MIKADATATTETHEFTVEPSIIMHLILSQAGSCGKAVLECVMNSIDAGANAIHIEVDSEKMTLADDGHGLRSRDEILAVFKRFLICGNCRPTLSGPPEA